VPSPFEQQIQEIDDSITYGEFQKGLKIIDKAIKVKGISKEEELRITNLKSKIKLILGDFKESLKLAKYALKESKKIKNKILQAEAFALLSGNYLYHNKFNEAEEAVDKGLELVSTIPDLPRKMFLSLQTNLLYWKIVGGGYIGDLSDKRIKLLQEAISYAEESGDKFMLVHHYLYGSAIYLTLNETRTSSEYYEKGDKIAKKLGNKFLIAASCQRLAFHKVNQREYQQAIDLLNQMLSLSEEIGSTLNLSFKFHLGLYYRRLYQYDKALDCYFESLEYTPFKHMVYTGIGNIYLNKYKLEQARKYLLQSLEISIKSGDNRFQALNLYDLIRLELEKDNITKANEYLEQLSKLAEETGYSFINQWYRLLNIRILKTSGKMSNLTKALELTNTFLAEEDLSSGLRLDLLYTLLEIRLKELQLTADKESVREVQKRLHYLEIEAEEQKNKWFLADVYRMQSQLALVELKVNEAIQFLDKAQAIAEDINNELLKNEIQKEREKIDQQLAMLQKFQEQKAPISETLKLVSLENTVESIKQEAVLEERDEETGKIIEYRKLFSLRI
jgi:tetratricopeptide (TPR) repeat protein